MKILALDTALGACSVAAMDGPRLIGHRHELMRTGQAERLMPMLQELLAETGLEVSDFDRLATTIGPGSFTGIRTALAAVRGLALAAGKPAIGVVTLEALALGALRSPDHDGRTPIAAAIDARKGEVYFQRFDADLTPLDSPALLSVESAAKSLHDGKWQLVGSGAGLLASPWAQPISAAPDPDARLVAELAHGKPSTTLAPVPLYIRPPDALLPSRPAWQ